MSGRRSSGDHRVGGRKRTPFSSTRKSGKKRGPSGGAFVTPLMVIFSLFYLWPVLQSLISSFFTWGLLRPWDLFDRSTWQFAGVDNYRRTLSDPEFWHAGANSLLWLVLFPLLVVGISLVMAVAIWHARRWSVLFRTVFVLPMTISLAAAGVIWSFVYNSDSHIGVLNAVLKALHLQGTLDIGPLHLNTTGQWLADPGTLNLGFYDVRLVNVFVIIAAAWAFAGYGVITFSAGLASLPQELIDSARVDGSGTVQVVRHVIVPHLRKPMRIVFVVSVIFALRTFDIVYVMTQGGPNTDSTVLGLLPWQQAFAFLTSPQAGQASAVAVLMSAVLIALGFPYLKSMLPRKESR
ncbi:carbohydrate ABC transporter permease [Streptomyces sp. HG99]|uniref:carbohydrate ABC transporter permease n=1 Tax=Streptomyces sp. HG99 TaxID=1958787 RepID=UPI00142D8861|nr:sugar ABC transporter permease [Streptomyces sp. HG99]